MTDPNNQRPLQGQDFHDMFGGTSTNGGQQQQQQHQQQQHQMGYASLPQQLQQMQASTGTSSASVSGNGQAPVEENPQRKRGKKRNASALATASGSASGAAAGDAEDESAAAMVFPVKLHRMLTLIDGVTSNTDSSSKETDNATSSASTSNANAPKPPHETEADPAAIVSWQSHGRCFLVHDKDAFVQRFLPSYFRQSKWASFQRQLNIYGFQRLTAGRDRGAYYHDLFVRGHPELATRIQRMKLKGIGQGRHRTNAELEPNFYRMTPIDANTPVPAALAVKMGAAGAIGQYSATAGAQSLGPQAVAAAAAAHPTANSALNNAATVNLLQLFQQGGGTTNTNHAAAPAASGASMVAANNAQQGLAAHPELTSLFFLTNPGDLVTLQAMGNGNSAAGGTVGGEQQRAGNQQDLGNSNTTRQHQHQSAQDALMLANLFNGTGSSSGGASSNHAAMQQLQLIQDSSGIDDGNAHAWAAPSSNFLAAAPLLQNAADANGANPFLNTATLMQYFSDNSPDRDSPPEAPAPSPFPAPVARAQQQQAQAPQSAASAWSSLAAATGLANANEHSSTGQARLPNSNSSNDLANTFQFEGPSLRRMSAAAMSTLLSAHLGNSGRSILAEGNNDHVGIAAAASATNATHHHRRPSSGAMGGAANNPFGGDSNQNLLLFSTLHNSRNLSSSNLLFQSVEGSTTGHLSAAPSATGSVHTNYAANAPGPAPTPASQQLALLNAAAAVGNGSNPTSGLLYSELGRAANAAANHVTHPTFLDSVYEPIPIKENANATNPAAGGRIGHNNSPEGSDSGQKVSPRASGAGTDPTKGFHPNFSDSNRRS
ncbi:stress transcription factor B-2b [Seminavis robusta]|uniref:Stress transcription factor B-2b n=1 Tax=Seminavis robusta TaxID=568900 RepID=A0A9N8HWX0_9STRA|nr:stress transcription factor B-2b [Seminavis robusta]|eukprot:Sro1712_g292900.1 stress transcription factor B-2b (830) ;mRNA; r:3155-6752